MARPSSNLSHQAMPPNSREHPHVISETDSMSDILTQLAAIQKEEHKVQDEREQMDLKLRYKRAVEAGNDMTEWKAMIGRELATRSQELEEAKRGLKWKTDGVLAVGERKKKELSEGEKLYRYGLVERKDTKVTSREKKVEGAKKELKLLNSPKLEKDGFEEVPKDEGS